MANQKETFSEDSMKVYLREIGSSSLLDAGRRAGTCETHGVRGRSWQKRTD